MNFENPKIESPKEKNIENKEKKLKRIREDVENWADMNGKGIDEGIKETVIILGALGLPTSQSCEGHIERGTSAPWVGISAPNEPEERFVGEDAVFKKVAAKYKISSEEAKRMFNMDAYWEASKECSLNGETEEYKKWRKENQKLMRKAEAFLEEFYQGREVEPNAKLSIDEGGEGDFRIHNGGEDYKVIVDNDKKLSEAEKEKISEKLKKYQAEMTEFTGFLKKKYFEKSQFEKKENLLKVIENENTKEKLDYFEIKEKIESLDNNKVEAIWADIGCRLKQIEVFDNLEQEGIDIFKKEKEWNSPYPFDCYRQEDIVEKLGFDYVNIGGFYKNGRVGMVEDKDDSNATKDNLAFLCSGMGLGRKAETFIHETYHGFQSLDPEESRQYWAEINEIEDKIKIIELESKIKNKPAYDAVPLRDKVRFLKKEIEERDNGAKQESEEVLMDRMVLKEVHSYMFADPTKYAYNIKEYTKEGILDAYFQMPIRKIHEVIGVKKEEESQSKIFRYDYIKGREKQAYVAFAQIEALRVLGLNNLEIGRIISESEYDPERGNYKKLREKIRELRESRGIAPENFNDMIDNFRIETVCKSLKARNIAKDVIEKYI